VEKKEKRSIGGETPAAARSSHKPEFLRIRGKGENLFISRVYVFIVGL